jgi:hypothetical protein
MKTSIIKTVALVGCIVSFFQTSTHAQELKFHTDGTFKIIQFTDIHACARRAETQASIQMINEVLDAEKPDLVILTGDVVTGPPAKEGWDMVTEPIIRRNIPFAATFGNHDDEQDLDRGTLAKMVSTYPGCLLIDRVENVKGFGNYVLPLNASSGNSVAAILYCMDSNAYSTLKGVKGYGWFGHDQVNWYLQQSRAYTRANNGTPLPALAFFHIALPEYNQAYNTIATGTRLEGECAPEINTGMFTAMLEGGDVMGTFVGHDHDNDYISNLYGIALTYGRFSGSRTTYTHLENGARVIQMKEGERSFDTWIRLKGGRTIQHITFPGDLTRD